jgi:enoyl-CoA hydratase
MEHVVLSHADDVTWLTIDRPAASNAISPSTISELHRALDEVERSMPRVLVVRGAGTRVFVSGGDLKELAAIRTREAAASMALEMRSMLDRLASLPCLTIAAVNGHALGGGAEVAVSCDVRVAADDVTLAFNQSRLAIMPAWGGIERLVGLVGRSRALLLMTTGERIDAETALRFGLVDDVVGRDRFDARVDDLVQAARQTPRRVLAAIKQVADRVAPPTSHSTADLAIESFAAAWVDDEHWIAADRLAAERARRQRS